MCVKYGLMKQEDLGVELRERENQNKKRLKMYFMINLPDI
jgi:hypothetical protein